MSERKAIYQHLTINCKSVPDWYQPFTATATTKKPYGVILFGDNPQNAFNRRSSFQDIQLIIYRDPGSFLPVDEAVAEVKGLFVEKDAWGRVLGPKLLTMEDGRKFFLEWQHTGRDFHDDELKAIGKIVYFTIPQGY